MKKKITRLIAMLLSLTMMVTLNANAASYRYYISYSSQGADYVDMTSTAVKEDIRKGVCFYHVKSNDGGTFTYSISNSISKTNTASASISLGLSVGLSDVIQGSASTNLGAAFSETVSSGYSVSATKPDSAATGYYYLVYVFPQLSVSYKRYNANSRGTRVVAQQTIKDEQKKNNSYVKPIYSPTQLPSSYFTC